MAIFVVLPGSFFWSFMIVLDNVSYSVEDDLIIKELTLSIKKGESIAVLGSNGCGKSTLAKLIDALIVPSIGGVKVSSFDTLKPKERRLIHREVGMVFQNPSSSFVGNTVREDIEFTLSNFSVPKSTWPECIKRALKKVKLEGFEERNVATLSGGEKQKLSLASILSIDSSILIFDEALSMLGLEAKQEMLTLIREIRLQGKTVIFITHEIDTVLDFDKVLLLKEGKCLAFDETYKVLTNYQLLEEAEVMLPFAVKVYKDLKTKGIILPSIPLTEDSLRKALW